MYLTALGQSGQGIRHRHLAALVALEAHPLQELAARQTIALPDQLEQCCPPAAAARSLLPAARCLSRCFAGLRRLIGIGSGKLTVYRVEPALQLSLLIENLLALGTKPVSFSGNKLGKVAASEVATLMNVGHSFPPDYRHGQSM